MLRIEIQVKGEIDQRWAEWFGGLNLSHSARGETLLSGFVPDQTALYGLICRLRDLGMELGGVQISEVTDQYGVPGGGPITGDDYSLNGTIG